MKGSEALHLIRSILPALALAAAALPAGVAAEPQGQLDANITLFTVMAAANVSGYDADLASLSNHPLRAAIRQAILQKNPPILPQVKTYFTNMRSGDSNDEFTRYVSFALSSKGPPDFKFRFRDADLPPDVAGLQELPAILQVFYDQAGIADLWQKSQPSFDQVIGRYHEPVSNSVLEINSYLRNVTSGYGGRRFQIYVDLLSAPNQIRQVNLRDDYFLVLSASPEPQIYDVRHAYLYYLLDSITLRFASQVRKKSAIADYARAAPALADHYKADFVLFTANCLVKAVEARLSRGARGRQLVDEALSEGFVLTPHFYEQLARFEKQEQSMRLYFPEMIEAIDLKKEEARLEKVEFVKELKARRAKATAAQPEPLLSQAQKTIEEAEALYGEKKYEKAREAFRKVLEQTTEKPLHARAYYGLGRIAILHKENEMGLKLLEKSLELEPDPYVKGWVLVYLGKLAGIAEERDKSEKYLREALAVDGASLAARKEAQKTLQEISQK